MIDKSRTYNDRGTRVNKTTMERTELIYYD